MKERQRLSNLRETLNAGIESGETDLTIKYVNYTRKKLSIKKLISSSGKNILHIYFQNISSLRTKLADFKTALANFLILSSSWIICIQCILEGYRSSDTSRKTSGVGVAVKSSIHSYEVQIDINLEIIFVSLPRHNLMINCIYIPHPGQHISVYEAYSD